MHLLHDLAEGKPCQWNTEPSPKKTRDLAYQIREALFAAEENAEIFPELAEAHRNFSIHVVEPGLVEARLKPAPAEVIVRPVTPIHGVGAWGHPVNPAGVSTADEVIEAWVAHLPSNDPLHFTESDLEVAELVKLYEWTQEWKPRLAILVSGDKLTLSLRDPEIEEFTWKPPVPEKAPEPEPDL